VRRRYNNFWRRPNGKDLAKLMHTSTSCTLVRLVFLSLNDCFNEGAKNTTEVGLSIGLIDVSRGGGYECGEY
jgi:hypothetical protein